MGKKLDVYTIRNVFVGHYFLYVVVPKGAVLFIEEPSHFSLTLRVVSKTRNGYFFFFFFLLLICLPVCLFYCFFSESKKKNR